MIGVCDHTVYCVITILQFTQHEITQRGTTPGTSLEELYKVDSFGWKNSHKEESRPILLFLFPICIIMLFCIKYLLPEL